MATTAEPANTDAKPATSRRPPKAGATDAPDQPLRPMKFERRALRPKDVAIKITHCRHLPFRPPHLPATIGAGASYPVIPGHEIVGTVTAVGDEVTRNRGWRHRRGRLHRRQLHGMRPLPRRAGKCSAAMVASRPTTAPTITTARSRKGGYTDHIVVRDHFVLKVPDGMDVSRVAPLLCAGITTYSPLRQYDVGPSSKVAVVGLGGLGHMGVKLARAMGAQVTMITTSPSKGEDARELGAHDVIISRDQAQMEAAATRFDFILNTIPVSHEIDALSEPPRPHRRGWSSSAPSTCSMPGVHRARTSSGWQSRGRRVGDRRHSRDAGDARFLRRRRASIPDVEFIRHGPGQRGLRAPAQERRALPLRDRHEPRPVSEAVHPVPTDFNARIGPSELAELHDLAELPTPTASGSTRRGG